MPNAQRCPKISKSALSDEPVFEPLAFLPGCDEDILERCVCKDFSACFSCKTYSFIFVFVNKNDIFISRNICYFCRIP